MTTDFIKFQWKGWRRFGYDLLVIQIGFLLFGLSIDMMVQADLGLSSWDVLHMALTYHLPISLGEASIGVSLVVVLADMILRERLGWGTIMNMLFIGVWIDLLKPFVPPVPSVLWVQVVYLLLGTLVMAFATAVYIGVDAGAGPRDSLMLALSRIGGISVRWSRTLLESATVIVGWMLGGPFWLGTIVSAVAIGPMVQLAFGILKTYARITPPQLEGSTPRLRSAYSDPSKNAMAVSHKGWSSEWQRTFGNLASIFHIDKWPRDPE